MAQSTCTADNCEKPHRARGLCGSHYNQTHQPNRHAKVEVACTHCGEPCLKERATRRPQQFCSFDCRDLWRLELSDGDPLRAARAARKPRPKIERAQPSTCRVYVYACVQCDRASTSRSPIARYCGSTCQNRARSKRRGKRHTIRRLDIFNRDGYQCWICEEQCDPSLQVPHPRAATVDHLIPQHHGGTHDPDNLATAHMSCNSSRGASWGWPTRQQGWGGSVKNLGA